MQAERYTQGVSRPLGDLPAQRFFRGGPPPDGGRQFTVLWNPGEDD
jgi:hypothetical protein